MKAKDLIEKLSALDPEMDVMCCIEDEEIVPEQRGLLLLEPLAIDVAEGERLRIDGKPTIKFQKSDYSERIAFINVTAEF